MTRTIREDVSNFFFYLFLLSFAYHKDTLKKRYSEILQTNAFLLKEITFYSFQRMKYTLYCKSNVKRCTSVHHLKLERFILLTYGE